MPAKRNPQLGDDQRLVAFRISRARVDRFREIAQAGNRTVSQELRQMIEERIAEADENAKAA